MKRVSYLVLVSAVSVLGLTFGAIGANATVSHKPLPDEPCDLVDLTKLEAALGVPIGKTTIETRPDAVLCFVPIPFDRATCIVQPDPGISVAVGVPSDNLPLKEVAALASEQGFEVRKLKGKVFGKKGAFLASGGGSGWTFYGAKGKYSVQIGASAPCGAVSDETLATVAESVAKVAVKKV